MRLQFGVTAVLAEPLLVQNRLLGVIRLATREPAGRFTTQDCELLTLFAAQAAIAIVNARLFEKSRQLQEWLTNILEINKRIAAYEDMPSLLSRITAEAAHMVAADMASVRILRGDHLVSVPHTQYGFDATGFPECFVGAGVSGRIVRENRPIVVPDIQTHPEVIPASKVNAAQLGVHSYVSIPVRSSQCVTGLLTVLSKRPRLFTEAEITALSTYAEQAALSIESARLLAALEERTAILEHTNVALRNEVAERQRVETERERLIAALEAKNAELEQFTHTVSHDLKSPLITIQGFVGLLENDAHTGDVQRLQEDIRHIRTAAATMQQLLDELLALCRIGRVVNPPVEISLYELAGETVTLFAKRIAARSVQVTIAPELPVVLGDRPRLREVLQNLLDNALKFLGDQPAPRITIGVRQHGEETVCFVQDNGIGIEPCYHEKIFGLFARLDATSDGTGIGLALARRITEVQGGRLWVESAGQGHGSTFCFTLPGHKRGTPSSP
jgi:signal transduction histidine kinase